MYRWNHSPTMEGLQAEIRRLKEVFGIQNVLIGLDFPPSYDYQPRWGFSRPVHPILAEIINPRKASFARVAAEIVSFAEEFKKIEQVFRECDFSEPGWLNPQISALDAASIFWAIAGRKPSTYLEVGSGLSTLFAHRAKLFSGSDTRIVSIDPVPRAPVDAICNEVIRCGLESCPMAVFEALGPGDVVFFDGSHRSFMNSDVTVFVLDVIPRLKQEVIVGIHDIHWPYDYSNIFKDWYWNEQYVLGAYLIGARDRVDVLFSTRVARQIPGFEQLMNPILNWWPHQPEVWLEGGAIWFTHR